MNKLKALRSKSFIKFIIFGAAITLLSNSSLLIMILILPLSLATFLTQIMHAYLGYLANKYGVFKRQGRPLAYSFIVIISWVMQWLLIKSIVLIGFSYLTAVIIAIPFMATFSFIAQKFIIFK